MVAFMAFEGFYFHDVGIFGNSNGGCNGLVSFLFFSFCNGCHPQYIFLDLAFLAIMVMHFLLLLLV
jgi:hypothetical protein